MSAKSVPKPENAGDAIQGFIINKPGGTNTTANIRPGPATSYDPPTVSVNVGSAVTYYPATVRPSESGKAFNWTWVETANAGGWLADVVALSPTNPNAGGTGTSGGAAVAKTTATVTPTIPGEDIYIRPKAAQANLRGGPRADFALVTILMRENPALTTEDPARVRQKIGKRAWIHVQTADGLEGWVRGDLIEEATGATPFARRIKRMLVSTQTVITDATQGEARALDFNHLPYFSRIPVLNETDVLNFSGFGPNNFAYQARNRNIYSALCYLHNGLDFGIPIGTTLCAIDWGVVLYVSAREGDNPYASGPHSIVVRYGNHCIVYGHMRGAKQGVDMLVKRGDIVSPGQPLGASGTFNSYPHLHFEIRRIDPAYIQRLQNLATTESPNAIPKRMNELFDQRGLRAWIPTTDYYINPALFFDPPLEETFTRLGWSHACPEVTFDKDNNGYVDFQRPGESIGASYDLYSLSSIPPFGGSFWGSS
jgi:SH3-like domain-containing protein